MDSKAKFDSILERAAALCDLHERLEGANVPGQPIPSLQLDDLLRSALMLGISAMDAYYRDKFLERLIPYAKKKGATKTLQQALDKANVSISDVLALLGKKRPHRTLRNKIANWLLLRPMHDLDQIDELMLGLGIKKITENAAKKDGAPTIRDKVKSAVTRRHDIVHYGGYYSGKNSLKGIGRDQTRKQLKWVARLVEQSESITNSATS